MKGVGNCAGVWGEVREVCWGVGRCGKCVGVRESMGRCGGWSRCVERVLGKGRWGSVGRRVVSRSGTPTLLTPTPRPQLPQTQPSPPTPTLPVLRFLAATRVFAFFKLQVECTLCRISGRNSIGIFPNLIAI